MRRTVTTVSCLGTGVLVAAALPPWGWWPLAFAGLVCLDRLIADRPRGARFRRGLLVGLGLYVPSLAWMTDLTLPGYAIATVAYAALFGLAVTVVPATAPGRWLALPGAVALTELLRWSWPFGGVPLSSLAVGQVAGPLAPVLRLGGALLLVEVSVIVGVALAAALARRWLAAGLAALVVVVAVAGAALAPRAEQVGELRIALVQGGGPQGTRAADTDERLVFERHMEASEQIETPVDLVVWPEDVVDIDSLETSGERDELAALARRVDAPLVVGVVEDAGPDNFRNASVVLAPDGDVLDRYDKVHRVPFGEYVPLKWLVERFGGEDLTARCRRPAGRHPGRRGDLVGDLLRRPGARGRRRRRRHRAEPHQRLVLHRHAGADAADRLVPHAGHRERPLAGPGGAHRLQRRHRPRRHGAPAQHRVRAGRPPPDHRRARGHDALHPLGPGARGHAGRGEPGAGPARRPHAAVPGRRRRRTPGAAGRGGDAGGPGAGPGGRGRDVRRRRRR
jgi:apolipoprotein N-acyltransferase